MNLVLDEAEEVHMKTKNRKSLGGRWRLFIP